MNSVVKRSIKFLSAIAIAGGITCTAPAALFQDIDAFGGAPMVSGWFDISSPSTESVTIGAPYGAPTVYNDITGWTAGEAIQNAWVWVYVRNTTGKMETAAIELGTDGESGGFASYFKTTYSVFGGSIDVSAVAKGDGRLSYFIWGSGGILVDYAALVARTDGSLDNGLQVTPAGGGDAVPDGGATLLLAGTALLGLAALRRRLAV